MPGHASPDTPDVPGLVVERLIGEGATARVFLARDVGLDMPITVKILRSELLESTEARARFEREARAAAHIVHPNVSSAHRFGALADGSPYLVTRYVRGRTLEALLAAEGALDAATTRRIMADVASGLDAAHRQGVIHRDVRPANILLDENDGRAILTDFGIAAITEAWAHGRGARLTKAGQLLGDPRYVSPEQLRGVPVSETSDVFSLALVAIEMLTGITPEPDPVGRAPAAARVAGDPIPLPVEIADADPALADLLGRCLVADPDRRPGAQSLARRLRGEDADSDAPAFMPAPVRRAWNALSRRRLPQWVAAVAATGVVVIGVTSDLRQSLPASTLDVVTASVAAAVLGAAILAWYHGERGEQRFAALEIVLLALVTAAWLASVYALVR